MSPTTGTVRLTNVSKLYEGRREKSAGVHDISLEAHQGEMLLLLGPSGSGKTTLLTLAAGLLEPTSGRIELFGRDIRALPEAELQRMRAFQMGFIFQTFHLIDALTVEENIALVRRLARHRPEGSAANGSELLAKFGLSGMRRAFPPTLSQGEKQRVAVARALVNDPKLLIADEPTASLSTEDAVVVIRILHDAACVQGKCVLVATHDLRLKEFADRVIYLQDGRIARSQVSIPPGRHFSAARIG